MSSPLGVCRAWEPCTCGEEIETDCIGVEARAAFREDESHARGQAGVKWGVRPAERARPTHCVHPRSWCQLSGVFVRGDAVVGRAAKGGVEGTPAALTERTSVLECAVGGIGVWGGVLRGIWFRGEGPSSTQHMPSLSQAGQLSRLILKEMVIKLGFCFIGFVSIFD